MDIFTLTEHVECVALMAEKTTKVSNINALRNFLKIKNNERLYKKTIYFLENLKW